QALLHLPLRRPQPRRGPGGPGGRLPPRLQPRRRLRRPDGRRRQPWHSGGLEGRRPALAPTLSNDGRKTDMATSPLPLRTEFLFRMVLEAGAPQMSTGAAARGGELRVVPVTGGTFEGPNLRGELVPGTTADWLRVEADGTAHMDVRL